MLVAQPSCVHAAELHLLLIPYTYQPKLQSALRILVFDHRLCKVEKAVSTQEGNARVQERIQIGFPCAIGSEL